MAFWPDSLQALSTRREKKTWSILLFIFHANSLIRLPSETRKLDNKLVWIRRVYLDLCRPLYELAKCPEVARGLQWTTKNNINFVSFFKTLASMSSWIDLKMWLLVIQTKFLFFFFFLEIILNFCNKIMITINELAISLIFKKNYDLILHRDNFFIYFFKFRNRLPFISYCFSVTW